MPNLRLREEFPPKIMRGTVIDFRSQKHDGATEKEPSGAVDFLKVNFHGKCFSDNADPQTRFLPPLFLVSNGMCMVTGLRKWPVPGGFPRICHGGLSLLEVASPWIELPAKRGYENG